MHQDGIRFANRTPIHPPHWQWGWQEGSANESLNTFSSKRILKKYSGRTPDPTQTHSRLNGTITPSSHPPFSCQTILLDLSWYYRFAIWYFYFCDRLESGHQEEKSFGEHVNPGAKNFYCVELEDKVDKDEKNKKAFKDNIRKMIKIVWIGQ